MSLALHFRLSSSPPPVICQTMSDLAQVKPNEGLFKNESRIKIEKDHFDWLLGYSESEMNETLHVFFYARKLKPLLVTWEP